MKRDLENHHFWAFGTGELKSHWRKKTHTQHAPQKAEGKMHTRSAPCTQRLSPHSSSSFRNAQRWKHISMLYSFAEQKIRPWPDLIYSGHPIEFFFFFKNPNTQHWKEDKCNAMSALSMSLKAACNFLHFVAAPSNPFCLLQSIYSLSWPQLSKLSFLLIQDSVMLIWSERTQAKKSTSIYW